MRDEKFMSEIEAEIMFEKLNNVEIRKYTILGLQLSSQYGATNIKEERSPAMPNGLMKMLLDNGIQIIKDGVPIKATDL